MRTAVYVHLAIDCLHRNAPKAAYGFLIAALKQANREKSPLRGDILAVMSKLRAKGYVS